MLNKGKSKESKKTKSSADMVANENKKCTLYGTIFAILFVLFIFLLFSITSFDPTPQLDAKIQLPTRAPPPADTAFQQRPPPIAPLLTPPLAPTPLQTPPRETLRSQEVTSDGSKLLASSIRGAKTPTTKDHKASSSSSSSSSSWSAAAEAAAFAIRQRSMRRSDAATNTTPNNTTTNTAAVRMNEELKIDPTYLDWKERFSRKLSCLKSRRLALYLYHVRKAAGTTVRDIMRLIAFRQRIPFYETEGIVLNSHLLTIKELFSIISFRDPINRIISLYWYEHVGWFFEILKQPHRCKSLEEWIYTWKDGSSYKNNILKKFPNNNYVEIENYYVKLLIGYNHHDPRPLTVDDLTAAKEILRQFDLILITEWMEDESEQNVIQSFYRHFYSSQRDVMIPQKVKGNSKLKAQLSGKLAKNEDGLRKQLLELNKYDVELFEYAKSLAALRLKEMRSMITSASSHALPASHCSAVPTALHAQYRQAFGVFQPPGHKGP